MERLFPALEMRVIDYLAGVVALDVCTRSCQVG